jgi:ribonuclease T1
VFFNREGRLPSRPRGYYREYTVDTPGLGHRGARRIVTGGEPPDVWYYTDDHYDSFRPFEPPP